MRMTWNISTTNPHTHMRIIAMSRHDNDNDDGTMFIVVKLAVLAISKK